MAAADCNSGPGASGSGPAGHKGSGSGSRTVVPLQEWHSSSSGSSKSDDPAKERYQRVLRSLTFQVELTTATTMTTTRVKAVQADIEGRYIVLEPADELPETKLQRGDQLRIGLHIPSPLMAVSSSSGSSGAGVSNTGIMEPKLSSGSGSSKPMTILPSNSNNSRDTGPKLGSSPGSSGLLNYLTMQSQPIDNSVYQTTPSINYQHVITSKCGWSLTWLEPEERFIATKRYSIDTDHTITLVLLFDYRIDCLRSFQWKISQAYLRGLIANMYNSRHSLESDDRSASHGAGSSTVSVSSRK